MRVCVRVCMYEDIDFCVLCVCVCCTCVRMRVYDSVRRETQIIIQVGTCSLVRQHNRVLIYFEHTIRKAWRSSEVLLQC